MMLGELLRAGGTDEEDRCRPCGTDNETDQLDGLGITPLQIVDDQQTRTGGDDDGSAHGIEQPLALSQVARPAPSGWLRSIVEFGHETSELGPPDCIERVDLAPERLRSKEVNHRTPGQPARSLVRTCRSHHVSLCSNAAAEFLCETRLSDPRFACHQHEMCPTFPRGVPCLVQLVQLHVAAHERRFGDGHQVLALPFALYLVVVECASPELLVDGPDRLAGCDRKLALEYLREPVVGAQRRGSVAKLEMCLHLNSNGRFVGRLEVDDALGVPDRGFVVVTPRGLFCQPNEGPIRVGSKSRSLVQDPVVITSWKEIARIEARGELGIAGRQGIAESQHVDVGWPSRNPPHNLVVDLDELTGVGK